MSAAEIPLKPVEPHQPIEYALAYAALGWPVIPLHTVREGKCSCSNDKCENQGKHPHWFTPNGIDNSTTDADTIRRWWEAVPDMNIGIHLQPAGLLVVDVDPRNGGDTSLLPFDLDTLSARTGNGEHFIYRVPEGYEPVSSQWAGVDIKWRGYIVAEPSLHLTGRRYGFRDWEVLSGEVPEIAVAPAQLIKVMGTVEADKSFGTEHVTEAQIADLRATLKTFTSDDRKLWVDVGLALASIANDGVGFALWDEWSQRSSKYDSRDQTRRWNGFNKTRQHWKAVFKYATAHGGENVMVMSSPLPDPVISAASITAQPFALRDPKTIEPRDWLYRRIFIRKYVTATFAPGAGAKTQITLVDAVSVACGFDLRTREPFKRGPLRVWYINVEDDITEIERRLAGIALHYNITDADLGGRLFIDTDREGRYVVAELDRNGVVVREAVVEAILEQVKQSSIDLFMVDPLVGIHAVTENTNVEMNRVLAQLRRVAEKGDCGVHVLHHVRKGTDDSVSADDGRGASAVKDACRAIRTLQPMTEAEAKQYSIDAKERRFYIWANPSGKPNLAPPADIREWYYLNDVGLGNAVGPHDEDRIGVPERWQPPGAFEGVTREDCVRVWKRIREAEGKALECLRLSPQARHKTNGIDTFVCRILGWGIDETGRAARIVNDWLKTGALVEVSVRDTGKSRDVPCVKVGPAAFSEGA